MSDRNDGLAARNDDAETAPRGRTVSGTITRLRLHSRGFLDQEQLITALGIDAPGERTDREAHIRRIAAKLRRAAAMVEPGGRS